MLITDSKYFTTGSAHEVMHGDDKKLLQYALYNPIIDRFVLTNTSFKLLQLVSVLFSGRYQLTICRLDRAANFNRNLIDNISALNWSGNMDSIEFTRFPDYHKILEPNLLIEQDYIDFKDQEYLLAAACWVDLILVNSHIFDQDFMHLYEDLLSEILPFKHPKKILTNKILHTIYREFDFVTAEKQINELISSYGHLDLAEFNTGSHFKSRI
tara:strand:+ start:772 stop:1407 length:636 start_codon:yes stop_codon:yes gene_type:complete